MDESGLKPVTSIVPTSDQAVALQQAGQIANQIAAQDVFADFLIRKSDQTIRRYRADLVLFAEYLSELPAIDMAGYAMITDPASWRGITWGIVEGFKNWMAQGGYSIASINSRLSAVKIFAELAFKAEALSDTDYRLIRTVKGYRRKEGKHLDEKRETRRIGIKKEHWVSITPYQAAQLKKQPDTPQGRRDSLMMCLLLDHGLRAGELAILPVAAINMKTGEMRFYRPKVDKEQTHRLTGETKRALQAYFDQGDAPAMPDLPILRPSHKGGALSGTTITTRAITQRVMVLGKKLEIAGLSAHDCRHYWATQAARAGTDPFRLQEAGGWSSLAMPRRYVEEARVANEGILGFDD
jgi:integrase